MSYSIAMLCLLFLCVFAAVNVILLLSVPEWAFYGMVANIALPVTAATIAAAHTKGTP